MEMLFRHRIRGTCDRNFSQVFVLIKLTAACRRNRPGAFRVRAPEASPIPRKETTRLAVFCTHTLFNVAVSPTRTLLNVTFTQFIYRTKTQRTRRCVQKAWQSLPSPKARSAFPSLSARCWCWARQYTEAGLFFSLPKPLSRNSIALFFFSKPCRDVKY